jgi:hypothetical protein
MIVKSIRKKLHAKIGRKTKPDGIIINFPAKMFREYTEDSVHRLFSDPALVWYSFINTIPVHEVVTCYIAWGGKIRAS